MCSKQYREFLFWTQEQDACADAEDRAAQLTKEKEKLEDQVKVGRKLNAIYFSCFYGQLKFSCFWVENIPQREKEESKKKQFI